jgi:hypothetical protein
MRRFAQHRMSETAPPFTYRACGLVIASNAAIPGLRSSPLAAADVWISIRGQTPAVNQFADRETVLYQSPETDASGRPELTIFGGASGYRLAYCDDTTFLIDGSGSHITVEWPPALQDIDAASYLIGSVLAFVIRLRGSIMLHASAVAVEGRAWLFVGESWAGKSSTAAAFSILGYPMMSDDIVRIEIDGDDLTAYPSHPRLNVWPDSAACLYGTRDAPRGHGDSQGKHSLDLTEGVSAFQTTPLPIEAVYLLGERSGTRRTPAIRSISPRTALMALVGHAYGTRFRDRTMRAREFDVLCRLVERVPVRELRFGNDLGELVSSCRVLASRGAHALACADTCNPHD